MVNSTILHINLLLCLFQVSDSDFKVLDAVVKKISKEKQPFQRLEMKKSDLLEMFSYNQFKVRILNEKVKTETTTVYKCGSLIDLCRGPHVRHTGKIKAMGNVQVFVNLIFILCARWRFKIVCLQTI